MADYQVVWHRADGNYTRVQGIEAKDEDEAKALVRAMKVPMKCELWLGRNMVAEVDADEAVKERTTRLNALRDMAKEVHQDASEVNAEDGAVCVNGPDGVDVKLTPEAAEETSERLVDGAVMARGQRRISKLDPRPRQPR